MGFMARGVTDYYGYIYNYTPLPWQWAGYWWGYLQYMHDYLMGSQIYDELMNTCTKG